MSRHSPVIWLRFVLSNYIPFNFRSVGDACFDIRRNTEFYGRICSEILWPMRLLSRQCLTFNQLVRAMQITPTAISLSEYIHSSAFASALILSSSRRGSAGPPQSFVCTTGRLKGSLISTVNQPADIILNDSWSAQMLSTPRLNNIGLITCSGIKTSGHAPTRLDISSRVNGPSLRWVIPHIAFQSFCFRSART